MRKQNAKIKILFLTAAGFGFFVLANDVNAATYYVAATGNDSNVGSLALPWATLSKANQAISAGDTVIVRGGTYRSQGATITKSNTTWQAYRLYPSLPTSLQEGVFIKVKS
jgi:hypothetical protein